VQFLTLKNEAVAVYISGNVSRNRILIPVPYHKRSCQNHTSTRESRSWSKLGKEEFWDISNQTSTVGSKNENEKLATDKLVQVKRKQEKQRRKLEIVLVKGAQIPFLPPICEDFDNLLLTDFAGEKVRLQSSVPQRFRLLPITTPQRFR
jgi:hypothetical protein